MQFLAALLAQALTAVLGLLLQRHDLTKRVELEGALANAKQIQKALAFGARAEPVDHSDPGGDFGVRAADAHDAGGDRPAPDSESKAGDHRIGREGLRSILRKRLEDDS